MRLALRAIAFGLGGLAFAVPALAADSPVRIKLSTKLFEMDANGLGTETDHAEMIPNNDSAAMQAGQQRVVFSQLREEVEVTEAYTLKKDGTRKPVSPTEIFEQPVAQSGTSNSVSDLRQKLIVFPDVAAGDTVVYTVKRQLKVPSFPGQFVAAFVFNAKLPVDDVDYTLVAPKSLKLSIETKGLSLDKHTNGQNVSYRWRYRSDGTSEDKVTAIKRIDDSPHVLISTLPTYEALGAAYWQFAAPAMALTPRIRAQADQITAGITDRREQIKALYAWVSKHIRYVAIELGAGAIVPHDAEAVLASGYGDCKDHVVLFSALLKAKDIASEAALINAGNAYELTKVPSFTQLNHVITFIPELNLYVDTTAIVAPFGVLPFNEYGKPVVHVTQAGGVVRQTPVLPPDLQTVTLASTSKMSADGRIAGTTVTTATGPSSIALRAMGLVADAVGQSLLTPKLMALRGETGTGDLAFASPMELGPSYSMKSTYDFASSPEAASGKMHFVMPGGLRILPYSGDGMMGPLYPGKLADSEPTPCYSGRVAETLSLAAPPGMRFDHVPSDTTIKTDHLTFTAHWSMDGRTMSVHREFASNIATPLCEGDVRKEAAKAMASIETESNTELMLVPESTRADIPAQQSANARPPSP